MRFEIVRLIHAKGVPNHYIYNQIYAPSDEEHKKRGLFVILIDHANTKDGTTVASLVNVLIREFYRQPGVDRLTDFEQALVHVNTAIHRLTDNDTTSTLDLNGIIVLASEDEIHISHFGSPHAFLDRDHNLIKLIEDKDALPDASSGFSIITSGEIREEDVLVLTTTVNNQETLKKDLQFSLTHLPLFEAGRAFARILRQKLERNSEVFLLRFNQSTDSMTQIYVDRPLESMGEKAVVYQKNLAHHISLVSEGMQFILNHSKKLKKKTSLNPQPETKPISEKEETSPIVDKQNTQINETGYKVRSYLDTETDIPSIETHSYKEDPLTEESPHTFFSLMKTIRGVKARTVYILIGLLCILAVIVHTVNALSNRSSTTKNDTKQTTAQRDTINEQAQAAIRQAETAQLSNDTQKATDNYLKAQTLLQTITNENETSKALSSRVNDALKNLTKAVVLSQAKSQPLTIKPNQIVMTPQGSFVLNQNNTIQKYSNNSIATVNDAPSKSTLVAATLYDTTKVLVLTSDHTIFSIDTTSNQVKTVKRSDNQVWNDAHGIASFDKNFYLIGDTIVRAIPFGDAFRTNLFNKDLSTQGVTSLVNKDSIFYGIENKNQIVRITSNSPKTTIALTGIASGLLPKSFTRLITNDTSQTFYLFDRDGKRIFEFDTQGSYKRQLSLPNDTYIDCDISTTTVVCITSSPNIKTFTLP